LPKTLDINIDVRNKNLNPILLYTAIVKYLKHNGSILLFQTILGFVSAGVVDKHIWVSFAAHCLLKKYNDYFFKSIKTVFTSISEIFSSA
jgi:hypothetical protein